MAPWSRGGTVVESDSVSGSVSVGGESEPPALVLSVILSVGFDVVIGVVVATLVVGCVVIMGSEVVEENVCTSVEDGLRVSNDVGVVVGTREVVTTGLGSTTAHRTLELLWALFLGHFIG